MADPARLRRALAQAEQLEKRADEPVERIALHPGTCLACMGVINPDDSIAGTNKTGWKHLACAVCLACGEWLTQDGHCSGCGMQFFHSNVRTGEK